MELQERKLLSYEVNLLMLALIVESALALLTVLAIPLHNAVPDICAALLGVAVLYAFSRSRVSFPELFRVHAPMRFTVFIAVLCVFLSFQLLSVWLDALMEYGLNMIGFSLSESLELATAPSGSVSEVLYACIVAPVAEEIIYRGYCLRRLAPYGRVFSIVVSAAVFGIMHANLPQMFFAFGVGLVLGYVAAEYGIVYAILLHFLNNCVFGDLLSFAVRNMPDALADTVFYYLFGTFAFCACIVLFFARGDIAAYLRAFRTRRGAYRAAFLSVLMVVFILMNVVLSVLLITPLA